MGGRIWGVYEGKYEDIKVYGTGLGHRVCGMNLDF